MSTHYQEEWGGGGTGMSSINILMSQYKLYMYSKGPSRKYPIPLFTIFDLKLFFFIKFALIMYFN